MNRDILAKVNCLNERHTIRLSEKGRLSLLNHDSLDGVETMMEFNPDLRCRCLEVKQLWNWYLDYRSMPGRHFWKLKDTHPWIKEVFQDGWGRFSPPTHSQILYALPRALREPAQEAERRRYKRKEDRRWGGGDGKTHYFSERFPHRWTDEESESFVDRLSRHSIESAVKAGRHKKIIRHLRKSLNWKWGNKATWRNAPIGPGDGGEMEPPTHLAAVPPKEIWKWEKEDWFRAVTDAGFFPVQGPPLHFWKIAEGTWKGRAGKAYPPYLVVVGVTGFLKRDRAGTDTFWAAIHHHPTRGFSLEFEVSALSVPWSNAPDAIIRPHKLGE